MIFGRTIKHDKIREDITWDWHDCDARELPNDPKWFPSFYFLTRCGWKKTEEGENREGDRIGERFAEGRMVETQKEHDEHKGVNVTKW